MPGDEKFGFDPNAFVQRLIDETGIPHVWIPIPTKTDGEHYACQTLQVHSACKGNYEFCQ